MYHQYEYKIVFQHPSILSYPILSYTPPVPDGFSHPSEIDAPASIIQHTLIFEENKIKSMGS